MQKHLILFAFAVLLLAGGAVLIALPISGSPPTRSPDPPSDGGGQAPFETRIGAIETPTVLDARTLDLRDIFDPSLLAEIDSSPVPVLYPSADINPTSVTLTSGEHWTAVSISTKNLSVAINATRLFFVLDFPGATDTEQKPAPLEATTDRASIDVGKLEGIWRATWNEGGAAYLFWLACNQVDDAACPSEVEVRAILESLVYIGGGVQ